MARMKKVDMEEASGRFEEMRKGQSSNRSKKKSRSTKKRKAKGRY